MNYPPINLKDIPKAKTELRKTHENAVSCANNPKLTSRFRFKVFRKNTRFKSYNLGYTNFVRKIAALQKRRTS